MLSYRCTVELVCSAVSYGTHSTFFVSSVLYTIRIF